MDRNMRKRSYELYKVEAELLKRCNLLKERFHLVNSTHWEVIYQNIAEAYAEPKAGKTVCIGQIPTDIVRNAGKISSGAIRLTIPSGFISCPGSYQIIQWYIF